MASTSNSRQSENYDAKRAEMYFGFDPDVLIEDLYNACDDFINDGMDNFQNALQEWFKKQLEEKSKRKKQKDVKESELEKNIYNGCDRMVEQLRKIFDKHIDIWEAYAKRNIFNVPEHIVQRNKGNRDDRKADHLSHSEEARKEDQIEDLRQKIQEQRKKRRTFLFLKKLYDRRIPQLRETAKDVDAAISALSELPGGGESKVEQSRDATAEIQQKVQQIVDQMTELRGVCARLAVSADTEEDTSQGSRSTSKESGKDSLPSFTELRARYHQDLQKAAGTGKRSSS